MKHTTSKLLTLAATLALVVGGPALAQSTMSSAQCDQVMMVGPQHFSPAVVAGCTPYFQRLADGAVAPGTFATVRPGAPFAAIVPNLSTSGTGG